jgi:hypothetical protein
MINMIEGHTSLSSSSGIGNLLGHFMKVILNSCDREWC